MVRGFKQVVEMAAEVAAAPRLRSPEVHRVRNVCVDGGSLLPLPSRLIGFDLRAGICRQVQDRQPADLRSASHHLAMRRRARWPIRGLVTIEVTAGQLRNPPPRTRRPSRGRPSARPLHGKKGAAMTARSDRAVDQALAYAQRGWPVFPCQPGGKEPATRHGFRDAQHRSRADQPVVEVPT